MRVLINGVRLRSAQPGGVHSGRPSGLMEQVQPWAAKSWWWYLHSRVRLVISESRHLNPLAPC
jgi:hypothetical protein